MIIDAKASSKMKLSHKIQIATYALILEQILFHEKLNSVVTVSSSGGVWIRYTQITFFSLFLIHTHTLSHFCKTFNLSHSLYVVFLS